MPDIRVVLLMSVLVPGAVLAQAPSPGPLLAPPLVAAPEEPAPTLALPPEERPPYSLSPGRVTLEVLGGAVGGVAGTFASLGLSSAVNLSRWDCQGDVCGGRILGAMAILGCGLGSVAGVYATGELMDGQGRFLPTLAAGVLMGSAAAGAYYAGVSDATEVVIPIMAVPMVTSVLVYEVSAAMASKPSRLKTSRSSSLSWTPAVALTPQGGSLGLIGRF